MLWDDEEVRSSLRGQLNNIPPEAQPENGTLPPTLNAAADDDVQTAAANNVLEALVSGFSNFAHSAQAGRVWFHLAGLVSDEMPEIRDGHFLALSLLGHSAASLLTGARVLLKDENSYASAALCRQLVEVEYLAWGFHRGGVVGRVVV